MTPAAFWAVTIGGLGVLDGILNRRHDGSTLSEVTRTVFHTNTPAGRVIFTLALSGGGFWFHRHIVEGDATWAPCSTS